MLKWVGRLLFNRLDKQGEAAHIQHPDSEEHCLKVTTIGVNVTLDDIFAVEDALKDAFEKSGVGIVDGHDIAVDGSHAIFYMYGPDAKAMFSVALPILQANRATATGEAELRFGDVDNDHARIEKHSLVS